MSRDERVMRRAMALRSRIFDLQTRIAEGQEKLTRSQLVGELIAFQNELTRLMLEPESDDHATGRGPSLVTVDHSPTEVP